MIENSLGFRFIWVFAFLNWLGIILFVIFELLTMRRLRKLADTQNCLGLCAFPGSEARSVAAAVTIPRRYTRWVRKGFMTWIYADCDAIYRNTSLAERCLARAAYFCLMGSGWLMLVCMVVDRLRGIRYGP